MPSTAAAAVAAPGLDSLAAAAELERQDDALSLSSATSIFQRSPPTLFEHLYEQYMNTEVQTKTFGGLQTFETDSSLVP